MIKKMVIRIDDVGYTPINNIGAFMAFDSGVGTAADVMLDTPGTVDALERLRNYPWISIGWHTHFWGSPVLDSQKVKSLVDPVSGHFISDIQTTDRFNEEELRAEMRAQLERCIRILGKAPETSQSMGPASKFSRIKEDVCREYGIVTDFTYGVRGRDGTVTFTEPEERWKGRKIYWMSPGPAYHELFGDSLAAMGSYDPVKYYTEDRGGMNDLPEGAVAGQAWHPGYVDYYMCREGDRGPNARNFLECRPIDTHALCSEELKRWIIDNKIELLNFRDALYGTRDYQNHLKSVGSSLYVGR